MSRGRRLVLEPGPLAHQPRRIASTIDRERPTISPEGSESNLVTASERSRRVQPGRKIASMERGGGDLLLEAHSQNGTLTSWREAITPMFSRFCP